MEAIELLEVKKKNNRIEYSFTVSEQLRSFFSAREFVIEYDESIEAVPDSVAAVPFVCCVLPIIWLTDSKLIVPELDETFYNCIPEVKKGYESMYPETVFGGEIEAGRIVPCDRPAVQGESALFYSGGVDSITSLIRHLDEKPSLLSIWGSDIPYENESGWKRVRRAIDEAADEYGLPVSVIRSTFRRFDNEGELTRRFSGTLKRGYWYGIKHGMGLLGHVAPYAYLHGLATMYIASSNCPQDGEIRCASDPRTDNHVRFAHCRVIHDGFELTRQDKIEAITEYNKHREKILPLHVCWETTTGKNCCYCEKCYRTMLGLILEGEDPRKYGFPYVEKAMPQMRETMVSHANSAPKTWNRLHEDVKARQSALIKTPYWKDIKWLVNADFLTPGAIKLPLGMKLKAELSKTKMYRGLRTIKRKLVRKR